MTHRTSAATVVWLFRGMTKIYRTHGSHKVQIAQPKFVCMGHTAWWSWSVKKGYIWFGTDVMWRRSKSRRIFTSMICLPWKVECVLGYLGLIYASRKRKMELVLSLGKESKIKARLTYYMTRTTSVCRTSVQQGWKLQVDQGWLEKLWLGHMNPVGAGIGRNLNDHFNWNDGDLRSGTVSLTRKV